MIYTSIDKLHVVLARYKHGLQFAFSFVYHVTFVVRLTAMVLRFRLVFAPSSFGVCISHSLVSFESRKVLA